MLIMLRRFVTLMLVGLVPGAWLGACAEAGENGGAGSTGGVTVGSGSSSGQGGASSGNGGSAGFDPGMMDGGLQDGDICQTVEADAELVDLDVLLVIDRSGSMETNGLWAPFKQAVTDFIGDSGSAGVSVGMSFYPAASVNSCPGGYLACKADLYGEPPAGLQVPLTALPAGEAALLSALNAETADGVCTPTYGALRGALAFAMGQQTANPKHKVIVVLVSDGDPNGCPPAPVDGNDIGIIGDLAANALNFNGVQTHVIAVAGANVTSLDSIAAQGGTTAAVDVTADVSQFLQNLQDIRSSALACEYAIPDASGTSLDPKAVNVLYTPGGATSPLTIPGVVGAGDCGDGSGWYYDNPATPTKILLCQGSCDTVQADAAADVKVAFGCPTEVK
jgi:hypothetical protein